MLTIDDSRWPLVSTRFQGLGSSEEMVQFYAHFEEWLAKKEPFALVLQRDDAEAAEKKGKTPESKQIRKEGIAWTKKHKPLISGYCAGVAMVPDSVKLIALWGPMVAKVTQNLYGCPGRVFSSLEEANIWAAEQLGIPVQVEVAAPSSPPISQLVFQQRWSLLLSGILAAVGIALGLILY